MQKKEKRKISPRTHSRPLVMAAGQQVPHSPHPHKPSTGKKKERKPGAHLLGTPL